MTRYNTQKLLLTSLLKKGVPSKHILCLFFLTSVLVLIYGEISINDIFQKQYSCLTINLTNNFHVTTVTPQDLTILSTTHLTLNKLPILKRLSTRKHLDIENYLRNNYKLNSVIFLFTKEKMIGTRNDPTFSPFWAIIHVDLDTNKIIDSKWASESFSNEIKSKLQTWIHENSSTFLLNSKIICIPSQFYNMETKFYNQNGFIFKNSEFIKIPRDKQPKSFKDIKSYFSTRNIRNIDEFIELLHEFNMNYSKIIDSFKPNSKISGVPFFSLFLLPENKYAIMLFIFVLLIAIVYNIGFILKYFRILSRKLIRISYYIQSYMIKQELKLIEREFDKDLNCYEFIFVNHKNLEIRDILKHIYRFQSTDKELNKFSNNKYLILTGLTEDITFNIHPNILVRSDDSFNKYYKSTITYVANRMEQGYELNNIQIVQLQVFGGDKVFKNKIN